MNKINKTIIKIHELSKHAVSGAIMIAMFQIPLLPVSFDSVLPLLRKQAPAEATIETVGMNANLRETFFGTESASGATEAMIIKQVNLVSTRGAYSASLAVVEKHAETIENFAREKNVPADVAIGVALLENGGSETAVSSAGALGVFQLMPGTARNLGLTVNKQVDERKNPLQNIEAGVTYLANNYARFGDWGLATWAYHAGEGNVSKALKIYAKENNGVELTGVKDPQEMREYVEKYQITVHKLLSDPAVKNFTKKLNDDSAGYPYKVVATAKLFRAVNSNQNQTSMK